MPKTLPGAPKRRKTTRGRKRARGRAAERHRSKRRRARAPTQPKRRAKRDTLRGPSAEAAFWRYVVEPGCVYELRAPRSDRDGTVSGYFTTTEALCAAAEQCSGKAPGVYMTLNPCAPDLLARANNCVRRWTPKGENTGDEDITRRRNFLIDIDPRREAGIPATDDEHRAALGLSTKIRDYLLQQKWPSPIVIDSGNGAYLIFAIDLLNNDESAKNIKDALHGLADRFNIKGSVEVDTSVWNAGQLFRIPGTLNRKGKGKEIEGRPHRLAQVLEVPKHFRRRPVSIEQLAALAPTTETPSAPARGGGKWESVPEFIARHKLAVAGEPQALADGRRKFPLAKCPFTEHKDPKGAAIFESKEGVLGFGCKHNFCKSKGRDGKALRKLLDGKSTPRRAQHNGAPESGAATPILVKLEDVEPESVSFLLDPYVPRNKVSTLEGHPGTGKTNLALAFASAVTRGGRLLGAKIAPGSVLYLTAEDGIADTIVPRLIAAGANLRRVRSLDGLRDASGRLRPYTLQDIPELRATLRQLWRPALVVIDPVQGFLGADTDMHRANEVRPILDALGHVAEEFHLAVLLLRHLRKAAAESHLHAGLGSIDFAAYARSILRVADDPFNPGRRILAHAKSSCSKPGPSQSFSLGEQGRITWRGESSLSAADLDRARPDAKQLGAKLEVFNWLHTKLHNKSMSAKELKEQAEADGISWRTVERVRQEYDIHPRQVGRNNWVYEWPKATNGSGAAVQTAKRGGQTAKERRVGGLPERAK